MKHLKFQNYEENSIMIKIIDIETVKDEIIKLEELEQLEEQLEELEDNNPPYLEKSISFLKLFNYIAHLSYSESL